MLKVFLFSSLLMVLAAPAALAAEGYLTWGTLCYGENPDTVTTFACDTNGPEGDRVLTVSFKPNAPMADAIAVEWSVIGQTDPFPGFAVPDWWQLGAAPNCRAGKCTFNTDFTAIETPTCVDWTGGWAFSAPSIYWSRYEVSINLGVAIDANGPYAPYAMTAGQEYYAGSVRIRNSNTVGTGSCGGCSVGMSFHLSSLGVVGLSGARDDFQGEHVHGTPYWPNVHVTWNSESPTPARNTTWGQIKGLYR